MENEQQVHKIRNIIGTVLTLVMLVLVGVFVWRVLYYAGAIRTGEINPESYNFAREYTTSSTLAAAPLPDGEFNVVTGDDPSLGNPNAPVEIVEFADFGCPYSQESSSIMRELALKYPNEVYFVYRDFPITEIHPIAQKAAEAGECADDQGFFWQYHDKLYQNQAGLDEDDLITFAEELNMNVETFEECLDSGQYTDEVIEDYADGFEAGVRGTPTFFINGNRIPGAIPADILELIVDSVVLTGEL